MKLETWTIPPEMEGQKLYPALRRIWPWVPESFIREAFDHRDVKMDGLRVSRDALMVAGAEVKVYLPNEVPVILPEVLYEDEEYLIIHKPIGLSCEADAKGGRTVGEWVYHALSERLIKMPMPCHRLDNQTDGILMLAKTDTALAAAQAAFRERKIHKKYECLVRGTPYPPEKCLQAYLIKDAEHSRVRVLDAPAHGALTIRTEYQVLEAGDVCRLSITLHTGRTHQIRAHLAHVGYPLLGDDQYGDRAFNRAQHAKRLMLTATELRFDEDGPLARLHGLILSVPPGF